MNNLKKGWYDPTGSGKSYQEFHNNRSFIPVSDTTDSDRFRDTEKRLNKLIKLCKIEKRVNPKFEIMIYHEDERITVYNPNSEVSMLEAIKCIEDYFETFYTELVK